MDQTHQFHRDGLKLEILIHRQAQTPLRLIVHSIVPVDQLLNTERRPIPNQGRQIRLKNYVNKLGTDNNL